MSNMSTLNSDSTRAAVTDVSRKEAATTAAKPAKTGHGGGKRLPPASVSEKSSSVKDRVAGQEAKVDKAIARLNDYVQSFQRDLRFSVDQELGRPIVRVVDRSTQEVIRQIPNEVVLRLARNLNELSEIQVSSEPLLDGKQLGLINTRV